jgi:hypothetical protein
VAHAQWFGAKAFMDRAKVQDAGAAAAYLDAERIPLSRPFVLIIGSDDWNNVAQIGNTARASVPPDRLASLYLYVGTPEGYLAKRPVDNPVSRSYFQRMQATYAQDPVAFVLSSFSGTTFDAWVGQHPTTRVAPRLAVLHGPVASVPLVSEAPSTDPIPWWHLGFLAVGALAALFLVGGGWVLVSFSRWFRPIELMAAAPTLGIAAIVVLGSILDRFGLRLTGVVGASVPVVAGLAGWVAWFGLSRSKRRQAAPA